MSARSPPPIDVEQAAIQDTLRSKGRWHSNIAGGVYDVRARQWAPEIGVFASIDEYTFHDERGTLWAWPGQNPPRFGDPLEKHAAPAPPINATKARSLTRATPTFAN